MTKLPLLFAFFALLSCTGCYKENRIKPVYQEETKYYYPVLSKASYAIENKVDSNNNYSAASFVINFKLDFRNRGRFTYKVNYRIENEYGYESQKNWITSKQILIDENLQHSERVLVNADSVLKLVSKTSSRLILSIQLINEDGGTIEIPSSSSSSSSREIDLSYINIETEALDRKYAVYSLSTYLGFNGGSDKNGNYFSGLSPVLSLTLSPLPVKPVSVYVLVNYKNDNYQQKTYPFAKTKPFILAADKGSQTQLIPLEYLTDTNLFVKGNYYFEYSIIESATNDTLKKYFTSQSLEKYSDDVRGFSLKMFELKDTSDTDKDFYPASYNVILNIASSDVTDKKYIAKILYANYGQNDYNQLVQLVIECNKDNEVVITGGNLLTKGFYDFKIEIYDFNSGKNVSEGKVINSWQALDNKNLQAIKLEKLSEDTP